MNCNPKYIIKFIFIFLINTTSGSNAFDTVTNPDAAQLEQMGREYFAKGDFRQAIHYLQLSLKGYEKAGNAGMTAKTFQNIGLAHLMNAEFDSAETYLLHAEVQFVQMRDKALLAECLNNLGLVSYYKGDYSAALDYYKRAAELYKEVDNPDDYNELINRIGMTYWSMGMNDRALQYLHEYAGKLSPEKLKKLGIGYNNLGAIYKDIGNTDKALEFYRKAAGYYVLSGDSLDLASPLTNIGSIFSSRNMPDSALFYYQKSLNISDNLNDRLQSAKTKHNIALVYSDWHLYKEAESLLSEYLKVSIDLGYKEGIAQAELSLANLSRKQGNIDSAIGFYEDCIRDAGAISLSGVLLQAHKNLSEVYLKSGSDSKAFHHFRQYAAIKDTLFNKEKARIIAELEARYETEKKDQENLLLLKENELKDNTIKTLYIVSGGLLILSASIIVLIILNRRNVMIKKRLAESEAARLSEKVDFQNRELATSALALSRNLSFIKNLLTELKELAPHVDAEGLTTVRSISRTIQRLDNDPAWEEFEMRFHQVHHKYYENLIQKYPLLTTNEVRLCALLKLGMNTKEIASVTFQNIRAIEAARLRLRKKLELESAEDLGSFLQKF